MSFLAPLFLLGALAVALPVIFHLIRRTTRDRTVFSSLMFLSPTPPQLTRRSRLEHLLLLLLRCAVLCLLAAGFARPFIKKAFSNLQSASAPRRVIVLVDDSASMRRGKLWSDARARAEAALRRAGPAGEVAVFTFDRQVHPVVTFAEWKSLPVGERAAVATRRLSENGPGWYSTSLGQALVNAAESLADTDGRAASGPREIVLISDLQEGSRLEPLQGYEWPKGIQLTVESLSPGRASNASLQLVADSADAAPNSAGAVRVRVGNAADSRREQFRVGWAQAGKPGFTGEPSAVYVPAGQSRILSLPPPAAGIAADHITLEGDDEDFDNTVFIVPPETERLNVLYFGNDSPADAKAPLYFISRAFQDTRFEAVHVQALRPDAAIPSADAQAAALFFINDSLPEAAAKALRAQITAGKTAFVTLESADMAPTLALLAGVDRLDVSEARLNHYAMLADIDFRHPLFAAFADPRFSDFTRIHFWKHRRLDAAAIPGARIVAKFDDRDPALIEVPAGKGRLFVMTSGWRPADSQLALSTKFVPILYALLDADGMTTARPTQLRVGDVLPILPASDAADSQIGVRLPDGSEEQLPKGETNFSRTIMPGIYTVTTGHDARRVAVNLDPAESRTAPLPADELERLGAPVAAQPTAGLRETDRQVRLQNSELEERQKLWRLFLIAALAFVLLESWLAGRTTRRLATAAGTATP
jgi:hypothetical protein